MSFRILHQDEFCVAIDKPAGFHVHSPEDVTHRIPKNLNSLRILRDQLQKDVYPVHRLDRATSGVVLFALNSTAASKFCGLFAQAQVKKTYYSVTRGWIEPRGVMDRPLTLESGLAVPALTEFERLATLEIPQPVGKYQTARYSLVRLQPHTGRRHQIRRHLDHGGHPIIGDTTYGAREHNHFFKNALGIEGLLLKAATLTLTHPFTGDILKLRSRWQHKWHKVFDLFSVCPWESAS